MSWYLMLWSKISFHIIETCVCYTSSKSSKLFMKPGIQTFCMNLSSKVIKSSSWEASVVVELTSDTRLLKSWLLFCTFDPQIKEGGICSAIISGGPGLVSVRLSSFYFGGSKLVLTKTDRIPRKLMYFVNRPNAESTKIGHSFRK